VSTDSPPVPGDGPDAGGVVVGSVVALAGGLFLLQAVVETLVVGPLRARPVALSGAVLAVGFCLGGVIFLRQGRRLLGIGHAGMGAGWGLTVFATATGSGLALLGGVGSIVGTAFFLVAQAGRRARGNG
jgi:hypothetical protein